MNLGRIGLGILAGASNAASKVADQWREDDIRAENHRMEMEKEKRLEEATIRAEGRQQGYTKEAEQRAIANRGAIAQQELDIANKPENVQAKANTEKALYEAKLKLEADPNNLALKKAVKQAENDLEIAKQVAIHKATDTTDYAGREIQHKLNNLEIQAKEAEAKGMPKDAKSAVSAYLDQAKALQVQASGLEIGSPERIGIEKQIRESHLSANSILQRYGFGASEKASEDPLQMNKPAQKEVSKTTEETSPVSAKPVEQTKRGGILNREELAGEELPYKKGMTERKILTSKEQLDKAIREIQKDPTLTLEQKTAQIKALTKQQ